MSRRIPAFVVAAGLVLTGCSGAASPSGEESFELQFASYNVPDAAESLAQKEWAKRVEERTEGRVKVEFFFQESLLGAAETLPGVADGRADLGWVATGYHPAELPLTSIVGIPFITQDPNAQNRAMADLYASHEELRSEWEQQGVHVLGWNPSSANIVASKQEVQTMDDLQGVKVRGYGYVSEALSLAGMNAIGLAQPEVYEALQRGVLDATSGASLNIAVDRKFQEVAPYFVGLDFGTYSITADVISKRTWDSLPEDIKEIMTEVSAEQREFYAEFLEQEEAEACEQLLAAGGTPIILSTEETQAWRDKAGPEIRAIWKEDVASANPEADADAFYEAYVDAMAREEEGSTYVEPLKRCAEG